MSGPLTLALMARWRGSTPELLKIADAVRRRTSDVRPVVLADKRRGRLRPELWSRPTCTVSWQGLVGFEPPRGPVFEGRRLPKSTEYTLLRHRGLPVPDWRLLREGDSAGIEGLGAYVVSKPNIGKQGADVLIRRADKVRWSPPKSASVQALHAEGVSAGTIAQRFVYTGRWPVSYRVLTLFGEVLCALRFEASRARPPLASADDFGSGGRSIVSSSRACTVSFCEDRAIIALAERAHAAFPSHPLLGFDILREVPSGRLFVGEANTSGDVWLFSGARGMKARREHGLVLEAQFGAYEKAGDVLARWAREWAR